MTWHKFRAAKKTYQHGSMIFNRLFSINAYSDDLWLVRRARV
jgi:hypothetical protein